jgi:hypothetical protein
MASHLADSSFDLLNSINSADANATKAGPILAPAADLASSAQSLATALGNSDSQAVSVAMEAIDRDEAQIESIRKDNPAAIDRARWDALKAQIASIRAKVPATRAAAAPVANAGGAETMPRPPAVVIDSRTFEGARVHVVGHISGTGLRSAGVYDAESVRRAIEVASVVGQQRVNFDLTIEDPAPNETIRVEDSYGRIASAKVSGDGAGVATTKDGREKLIELGNTVTGGATALRRRTRNNIAEIPPTAESADSVPNVTDPSRPRAPGVAMLSNVGINIIAVNALNYAPGTYQVVGQIQGAGVRRAGIYVDGRLIKPIALASAGYGSFDITFTVRGAEQPSIRAYGGANDFVEASIDLSDTAMPVYGASRYYAPPTAYGNPYAYGPNPYGPPINPYGSGAMRYGAPPPTPMPWWRALVP